MTESTLTSTVARLNKYLGKTPDAVEGNGLLGEFFTYLVDSEKHALALIEYVKHPKGPKPTMPTEGSIEFGFVLYWIHYPPHELTDWLKKHNLLRILWDILKFEAPATNITTTDYEYIVGKIETESVPWDDGTLIGTKKYEELDKGWLLAALNYAMNNLDPDSIHAFPKNKPHQGKLCVKSGGGDPTLAIIGDWGTGYYSDYNKAHCPAQRVAVDLRTRQFDYLIHLGDVYYAGTDFRPMPDEELDNFLKLWPDQGAGRNFTLNSNHEMYGDASGYFDQALAKNKPFNIQNGSSYFALTYTPWLVLG
ncbi:MAG: hypothetical protein ACC635_04185, partial [Acidiferrobacterales bacterium]